MLNHGNVVQAREIPEELHSIALNDLPLLAMEYCSRGDLRKVLNKPENCCGLKESEVLSLLSDIGSGIQYLHENKIIHRDLKPENIVLQEIGGKLIHKIIDLGYAKDLDQGSLCTSFVGTLQYLAPELFESKPYTVTVDYWSFGTVIFECTCGFRPFLHHMQPVQWTSKVKNKGPKDIVAVEDMNGEVRFSTHLPYPNNVSRPLLEPVESLLQMLLLWDAAARGGGLDPDTNKPHCYTALQNILSLKVIHVLDMTSAQLHSLILGAEESLHSLQLRLETHTQTHVSPLSQELLLETGISLDPRRPPAHCLPEGLRGWDSSLVFLFDKSLTKYSGPLTARPLPDSVNFIVRETKTQLPLSALRKVWGEAVSYICGLKEDYIRLYQGQRAAMLSLLRYNTNLTRYKNLLFSQSQQLRAKLAIFKTSIQNDLEQYTRQRHVGICEWMLISCWDTIESDVMKPLCYLLQVAEVGYLDEEIVALHSEIVELQRSPFARRQGDVMEQTWMIIDVCARTGPDPPHGYSDSSDMVRMILQTVQNQDRVLKDLYTHLSTILVCKQRIVDLFPKLERAVENIKTAEAAVMQMQMKRQKEFWYLLKIACVISQLLDENQRYLSQLTSLVQDATQEMEHSIMVCYARGTQCVLMHVNTSFNQLLVDYL
uniref:Inhibitor of nuclear factor kappa-B kinase subunit alpha n=1 Tax=Gasterosteus aculeatus aculeatus TaxID=481459 RepID=A0AAQ4PYI1_GASAC